MTLLERLKTEFREKLELIKQQYPSTYEDIIRSLRDNDYYTELKVREVVSLSHHLDLDLNIGELNKIFIS